MQEPDPQPRRSDDDQANQDQLGFLTPMMAQAGAQFELLETWVNAGFTRTEAFVLLRDAIARNY